MIYPGPDMVRTHIQKGPEKAVFGANCSGTAFFFCRLVALTLVKYGQVGSKENSVLPFLKK